MVWRFFIRPATPPSTSSASVGFIHPSIPRVISTQKPVLTAPVFVLTDNDTNQALLSRNEKVRIYPASITKLATALTALNIYSLDEVITITDRYTEGKVMGLVPGEKITVRSLVMALLVYSANDAAYNLAKHHRDGIPGFISEMNHIAKKYGLNDTNFVNFDGIHHPDHYSTAADLIQLGRLAVKNKTLRNTVAMNAITVSSIDNQYQHQLQSTNELLGVTSEIEGLKTGWTPEAGGCFLGLINVHGHYLVSVVSQSPQRFSDTQALVNWSKTSLNWTEYKY